MINKLSAAVQQDIKDFIFGSIESFRKDAEEYDGLDLTVACSEDGTSWNYQTGDNSFTGGAYGLPHWGVTTIMPDSDPIDIYQELIDQLDDLLAA